MANINAQEVTLWHGGRELQYTYGEVKQSSKGRWENGPGLYLTTHYETAKKYAKGGGTTYQVTIELGTHIKDVKLNIDDVLDFVKKNVVKSKQRDIANDLHDNIKFEGDISLISAEILVNLCVTYDALKGDKTIALNRFLVENGVDYATVNNFGGRYETVCVVYNLAKIKKVSAIMNKDVQLKDFELNFPKPLTKIFPKP